MPEIAAMTTAYLLSDLKSTPENMGKPATIIATAAQNLLIVRQKFQHTILQSTSKIVIECGFHHIRQYTTQDITINPLKTGNSQLMEQSLFIATFNFCLHYVKKLFYHKAAGTQRKI
jgi:hypothetical protein